MSRTDVESDVNGIDFSPMLSAEILYDTDCTDFNDATVTATIYAGSKYTVC